MDKRGRFEQLENAEPSRPVGRALVAVGLITAMIGVLLTLSALVLESDYAVFFVRRLPIWLKAAIPQIPEGTPRILLLLPGALMVTAAVVLIKRGRRHLVRRYRAGALHVSENTILYLRPFVADNSPIPHFTTPDFFFWFGVFDMRYWTGTSLLFRGVRRYEELIAYAFKRIGTLVTIGNPTATSWLLLRGETRYSLRSVALCSRSWRRGRWRKVALIFPTIMSANSHRKNTSHISRIAYLMNMRRKRSNGR